MSKADIIKEEINKVAIELSNSINSAHSNLKDSLGGPGMDEFDLQMKKASKSSKRLLKLVQQLSSIATANDKK